MQTLIPEVLMSKKKMICFTWLLLLSLGLNQSGLIRTCFSNLGNGSEHVTSKEKTSELGFKYLLKKKKKKHLLKMFALWCVGWIKKRPSLTPPTYFESSKRRWFGFILLHHIVSFRPFVNWSFRLCCMLCGRREIWDCIVRVDSRDFKSKAFWYG